MKRTYVAVIEYNGQEEFRSEPLELHLARMAIADWKSSNPDKVNVLMRYWLESPIVPRYLPEFKSNRWQDKSEQEKTVEKWLT